MKKFDNRFDWHKDMNDTINRVLCKAYPRNWNDEDYLTRAILVELRNEYKNVEILHDKIIGKNIKFSWDVFKNTKQHGIEPKHGDVGILVQMLFENGKILEGVAYLEAKRMYASSHKFDALDFSQLQRLVSNSANHRTVFYDFLKCADGGSALAVGLPTQHLIAIKDNSRKLYPYCEYYSYILTSRYLQGYELDYSSDAVNGLKGLIGANGGVDYLIVAQTTGLSGLTLNLEQVDLNLNIYEELVSEGPDDTPENSSGGLSM